MTPDYETAAIKASETLIKYSIKAAPVDPLPILKSLPNVLVVSYETMSKDVEQDRNCVISMFGRNAFDACTSVNLKDGKKQYLVAYNRRLPVGVFQRALARELGHIILGHDGTKPEEVRNEEAKCFAHHLLCPRPLIHAIQATNVRMTEEVLGNLTGSNDHCISCMQKMPPIHVPAELNRTIKNQFMDYFMTFFEFQRGAALKDRTALADIGTYMDGYAE